MSIKSSREFQKQNLRKAYFNYWLIQNNPSYRDFWRAVKEKGETVHSEYIYDPPLRKGENYGRWFERTGGQGQKESWLVKEMKRFGVWLPLPDPFKKIDWTNFEQKPDSAIIESMNSAYAYNADLRKRFPVMIDPLLDDYEIYFRVNQYVKFLRTWMSTSVGIPPTRRHHIIKFQFYAQVWDLRKGFPKKSFREIARELRRPIQTVISQFKRAYELLYDRPYEATGHRAMIRSLVRKTTCKDCPEQALCKKNGIPCPDVEILLREDEKPQAHRLDRVFIDRHGEKKSTYDLAVNREAYRRWQEEKSQ